MTAEGCASGFMDIEKCITIVRKYYRLQTRPTVYDGRVMSTSSAHTGTKLNRLQRLVPEGLLVNAAWLEARGYSRGLRSRYPASGWLEQPARGSYRRPGGKLLWQHVVVSLQGLLQIPVIVGGRTALELHGFSHYASSIGLREVHLYGDKPPPG